MANSSNYYRVSTKTYSPDGINLRYVRGGYMFKEEYKRKLISEVGDAGYILLEYIYSKNNFNYFVPTNNVGIGNGIGWTSSKVESVKTKLVKAGYLLILKDTARDGAKLFRVIMGKEKVLAYKTTGKFPEEDAYLATGASANSHD